METQHCFLILYIYECCFQQYSRYQCKSSYALVFLVTKRDAVTGEWRKLHNEELNDLYS